MRAERLLPDDREFLSRLPLFATLDRETFDEVAASAQVLCFTPKTIIFNEGERATDIFAVVSGWVKLYRISPGGEEAVIRLFQKGNTFAEAVGLLHDPYPACAEAVTACRVIRIGTQGLAALLARNPMTVAGILASMSAHLHQLVNEITRLKALNGPSRIVEFLHDVAGADGVTNFVLPFEKQLMARHLNMQPESLSRTLRRLRDFGIRIDGRQVLLDSPDALARAMREMEQ